MLARPRLPHAPDAQAMSQVIEYGIPGTEMPGHWFTPLEISQVVAFVETLGRVPPRKVAGDPARGAALYAGKGACSNCHTVNGRGGALGPDLTGIGAIRSPSYLRESLLGSRRPCPKASCNSNCLPVTAAASKASVSTKIPSPSRFAI